MESSAFRIKVPEWNVKRKAPSGMVESVMPASTQAGAALERVVMDGGSIDGTPWRQACPHAHRTRRRPAILAVAFHTKRRGATPVREVSEGSDLRPGTFYSCRKVHPNTIIG